MAPNALLTPPNSVSYSKEVIMVLKASKLSNNIKRYSTTYISPIIESHENLNILAGFIWAVFSVINSFYYPQHSFINHIKLENNDFGSLNVQIDLREQKKHCTKEY